MFENLSVRELETMKQFLVDHGESKETKINNEVLAGIVNQYKLDNIEPGNILVKVGLSIVGGHIELYDVNQLGNCHYMWNKYGDRADIDFSNNQVFLIENPDYQSKTTEPYNRQGIFYIGRDFANLTATNINNWTIYTSDIRKTNINLPTNDFNYNDFWQTIDFTIAVDRTKAEEFITKVLQALNYSISINWHIGESIKSFVVLA